MGYSLSDKMLLFLSDFFDTTEHVFSFHYIPPFLRGLPKRYENRKWMEEFLEDKNKRQKIHSALANLKRRGYLQKKKFEKSYGFILTPKAQKKIFSLQLKIQKKEKLPHNEQLMIFYDIPEKFKYKREIFRNKLKDLGFDQLQKSIWITSNNIIKDIRSIIKDFGIEDGVQMLKVKDIKIDKSV
ncbi:MAG: repressor in the phenylacetic acid catabolic pathway [Parcubacteria group bacterium GW2011_GWA2_38_13]|nr:MAG: repressor in the phenylacetic acid catabolic pathway [Parcubacteria group bacterium GW2011_GWA2_38_13]